MSHAQEIREAFRRFDVNGDGCISRSELRQILKRLNLNTLDDQSIDALLQLADTNGDGFIQYNEFISWIMSSGDGWDETRQACVQEVPIAKKLRVTIIKAEGLQNSDWIGKSDPYCICELQNQPESRVRTPVLDSTLDPVWNYEIEIVDPGSADGLQFMVKDKDIYPKPDDMLGYAFLQRQLYFPDGFHGTLPLEGSRTPGASLTLKVIVLDSALNRSRIKTGERPALDSDAVARLHSAFPSWDVASLRDMLGAMNGDVEATERTLLQWTGEVEGKATAATTSHCCGLRPLLEPISPWHAVRVALPDPNRSAAGQKAPTQPLERTGYDAFLAERLVRRCSGRSLATSVYAAAKWRRRSADNYSGVKRSPAGSLVAKEERLLQQLNGLSREDAILEGKELLRQRCAFLELKQNEMKDDGNCQFQGLSQELFGSPQYHAHVRAEVVSFLRHRGSEYSIFYDGDWDTYLQGMARLRTWGDEMTLRAASEAFSVRIHLVTSTDTNWYLVYEPSTDSDGTAIRELFLTYIAPVHYNVLELKR